MRILSFNSSTADLHVCLAENDRIIAEQIIVCNANNASELKRNKSRQFAASLIIPTVTNLLSNNNWSKSTIGAIAVGIGPGSFTGIRIAVVTARTLAQALSLPLLGINEFECYAFDKQLKNSPQAIALDAGKKQYYCAHIENIASLENQPQIMWNMTVHHISEQNLQSHLQGFKHTNVIPESFSTDKTYNQATIQAILAHRRLEQTDNLTKELHKIFPYHLVKPLYVRDASITISSLDRTTKS